MSKNDYTYKIRRDGITIWAYVYNSEGYQLCMKFFMQTKMFRTEPDDKTYEAAHKWAKEQIELAEKYER